MEIALFKNIKDSILTDLKNAKLEINIAVAWFTNHEYYNVLIRKLNEGIKVTIIIINDPINNREGGLDWQNFINSGGILHFSHYPKIMHHKFCIIDNEVLYNGSYNWTYYAEKINRENTIRHTENNKLILDFQNEFDHLKQKNKRYKRVKRYTLDEMLKFQIDKALKFYISKELEANSKWLTRNKHFEIAQKVLSTSISFGTKKEQEKLQPIKERITVLNNQIINSQKVNSTVDKELKDIYRKQAVIRTQTIKPTIVNRPITTYQNNSTNQNRLADLKRQEELLKSLKKEKFQGDFGELRINLKWETFDDLDLHVIDPSGNHICYSATEAISEGSKGQLDVDANAGEEKRINPQENIYWETNPPSGIYKIVVVHFAVKQEKDVPFILSIIAQKGKSKIIYSKIHNENLKTMLVAEIKYVRGLGITEINEKKILTII